jgi:hypothetical protein
MWLLVIFGETLPYPIDSLSLLLLLLLGLNYLRLTNFSIDSFFFLKLNLIMEFELLRLVLLLLDISSYFYLT